MNTTNKTPSEILVLIKQGKPYTYNGRLTKGRKFTLFVNNKGTIILSCNQLKGVNALSEKDALVIIENDLSEE